ncbi:MAG: hypothetical protein RIS35_678 [Pseudomonadota bacterium]|jgi:HPt (histidine-containing phosphotransfer) domain-containing protein
MTTQLQNDMDPEFDLDAMQAIIELDPSGEAGLVRELVETFTQDSNQKLTQLRRHLSSGDAAAIHAVTHQLKSSSATLGLARFSRLSRAIDEDARRGGLETARKLVDELDAALVDGQAWLMRQIPSA